MNKSLAIIAGEPNSISSEIIFKSWKLRKKYKHKPFFIIGSINLLNSQKRKLKYKIEIKKIEGNFKINDLKGSKLPVYDINYYQIGDKHGLETIDILNDDGTLNESAQLYIGKDRLQYFVQLKKIYPLVSKYFFKLIKRLLSPFFSNKRLLASNNVGKSKPKSLIPGLFMLPANIICLILFESKTLKIFFTDKISKSITSWLL